LNIGEILKDQYAQGHSILQGVLADIEESLANKSEGMGTVGSIGSIYAHMVFTEDAIMAQGRGKPTIYESAGWAERIGLESPGLRQTAEWAASVKITLPLFHDYAKEVFSATEEFVASLTGEDLEREITGLGGRQIKLAVMVATVGTIHISEHTGEIAALKGVQGLKGLPF
jgi:hypothetical protein